ncbi:MAG: hypothetical protein IKD76_08135 [Clostridia bacterium]|nr:hypothetical protein [Clostridia bacterium]
MKVIMIIIYILLLVIAGLIEYAILQIKLAGMKVKDFWTFIKSVQNLDALYKFSKRYEKMSTQEQIIFLTEAEKMFSIFEKVPANIWEDEYEKYSHILEVYRNIRMLRWAEVNS